MRKYFYEVFIQWIKECFFNLTMAILLAAAILLIWRVFNPPATFVAEPTTVAAMRMPASAMSNLFYLSRSYNAPFAQVLTMYAVANDFFPPGPEISAVEINVLHQDYISGFNRLRRQYSSRDVRPYFELFTNIINEIEYFPVQEGYKYSFSDIWDNRQGTAILDLANTRGNVPVLSMTGGHISHAAWHRLLGYHIMIVTESGTRILYAHLDGLSRDFISGTEILPGSKLGTMGNSGELAKGKPVHLHVGISPAVTFADNFWINPYPFLRFLEEKMYNFP